MRTFAASWPKRDKDVPLAAQLNRMRKVVISDHLDDRDASWDPVQVIRHGGDITAAIATLSALNGVGRASVAGSVTLVESEALGRGARLDVHRTAEKLPD